MLRLARVVDTLILDHHLLRCEEMPPKGWHEAYARGDEDTSAYRDNLKRVVQ